MHLGGRHEPVLFRYEHLGCEATALVAVPDPGLGNASPTAPATREQDKDQSIH
jgi:hypothetical protein